MTRRVPRAASALAALALLLAGAVATAAAPEGPRLALVKLSVDPLRSELLSVDPAGALPLRLAAGNQRSGPFPEFFSPLSWSSDGGWIAFAGTTDSPRDGRRSDIYMAAADGSAVRRIARTSNGYGPVLSPDGRTLAFSRQRYFVSATTVNGKLRERSFEGATVWTLDLSTQELRQVTPWRDGLEYFASSFSPDGSTLLATRQDDRRTDESEPVALDLDGGGFARLRVDGALPVYSPDGSEIALFREASGEDSDLFVMEADGNGLRRLTRTPDRIEAFASWDPSGQRLAYMRFAGGSSEAAGFGIGGSLMQVNADGSCPTKTLSAPRTGFYVPSWQPGPGREAGRIAC